MTRTPNFNVYVSGNGPYPNGNGGHYDQNSSHEVTKLLPTHLAPSTATNPNPFRITIVNPTAPDGCEIKTEYGYIRRYIRELHASQVPTDDDDNDNNENENENENKNSRAKKMPKIDLFIHLGQAGSWDYVSVERLAFRQDMTSSWWSPTERDRGYYRFPDNIGQTIDDVDPPNDHDATNPSPSSCPWIEKGVPIGLTSALNVDRVAEDAKSILDQRYRFDTNHNKNKSHDKKPISIRPHFEAGFYCCGFIYYESMANCFVNHKRPMVLFCHVPGELDTESLERAKDAVLAIIVAAAAEVLRLG